MRKWLLIAGGCGILLAGFAVLAFGVVITWWSRDLPDHQRLIAYEPPVLSRVHSADGSAIANFAREFRVFTPVEEMPDLVKQAFISAEDKNFYHHSGVDLPGIAKALVRNVWNVASGRRLQGASTITQQVAKNMLLGREQTLKRKVREAVLARRLVRALSRDRILELYLNEIFLGARSYGVTAAAIAYFDKPLDDLEVHEAAYLAALPKGPNNYHPTRYTERAKIRRLYVLNRMREDGFIDAATVQRAAARPLGTVQEQSFETTATFSGAYFIEEIRRSLLDQMGEAPVYEGGLSIRATLSKDLQRHAEWALRSALEGYDRKHGYAGPVARIPAVDQMSASEWRAHLSRVVTPRDIDSWHVAVVLELDDFGVRIGVEGFDESRKRRIVMQDVSWARRRLGTDSQTPGRWTGLGPIPIVPSDVWAVGDVIYVSATHELDGNGAELWSLRQIPAVQGAFLAMDPRNGRVLAMQGGFSFEHSSFNRATQALRQPGSAIKPFIYAAALDHGHTPATLVLDAPIVLEQGPGLDQWRPHNSTPGRFSGPTTLRRGLEDSRNLMTVRLARQVGLETVALYTEQLGIYDDMPHLLSYSLGAGETTLLQLVRGYAVFANGGNLVEPILVDRIQDRRGQTITQSDDRPCVSCQAAKWIGQEEPYVPEEGQRVLDPVTAFQLNSMLEGAVMRGTGRQAQVSGMSVAGKTGTTNERRDAWFIGYTPEVVAGCYIGYDEPRPLGDGGYGGQLCGPVVGEFLTHMPESSRGNTFPQPAGVELVRVNRVTGVRATDGARGEQIIEEAFREGTVPATGFAPVAPTGAGREQGGSVGSGTGGLY